MREIQDMTLNVSRGLERLERRLRERSERFQQEFDRLQTPEDAFGIRLTATPVGEEIRLDRVFWKGSLVEEFQKPRISVFRRPERFDPIRLGGPEHIHNLFPSFWRPKLRAARTDAGQENTNDLIRNSYQELHCDGLIELGFVSVRSFSASDPVLGEIAQSCDLRNDLPIVMFADLAVWADHVRKQALAPAAEYVLEVEIRILGGIIQVEPTPYILGSYQPTGTLQPNSITFPRYSLIDPDEIPTLMALFERDFWNYMAKDISVAQGTLEIQKASSPN